MRGVSNPFLALPTNRAAKPGVHQSGNGPDAEELLRAGIDVISALDVRQLDSLRDVVEKITGGPPGQTVPDAFVRAADEVEMLDIALRNCAIGWRTATSTQPSRPRLHWPTGSASETRARCASYPCSGWPPSWLRTGSGTVPPGARSG